MAKDAGHKGRSYALERVEPASSGASAVMSLTSSEITMPSEPTGPREIDPWA